MIENDDRVHFWLQWILLQREMPMVDSLVHSLQKKNLGDTTIPMRFIRAPYIEKAGDGVEILSVVDGKIVAARQGNQLVSAFHPELTDSTEVHKYFAEML